MMLCEMFSLAKRRIVTKMQLKRLMDAFYYSINTLLLLNKWFF